MRINKYIKGGKLQNIKKIGDLYKSGSHATSFAGRTALNRFFKKVPASELNQMLSGIESYTRHKQTKRPKTYNPIYVRKKRRNLQGDLIQLDQLKRWNDDVTFILIVIDSFSRKIFMRELESKTGLEVKIALEGIIKRMGPLESDVIMCFDQGKEVRNKIVKDYLDRIGMQLISSKTGKCVLVERAIADVKRLIMQYITETESRRYIHKLQEFETLLNNRFHRSLGMSPIEAEKEENRMMVLDMSQRKYNKIQLKESKKKPKFKVGDKVRFANHITHYKRAGDETFKIEVCKIKSVLKNLPVIMYELEEYGSKNPELIDGRWYAEELTHMSADIYKVNQVLSERVNDITGQTEYLVSWLGYKDKRFNSYVPKDKLTDEQYGKFSRKKARRNV